MVAQRTLVAAVPVKVALKAQDVAKASAKDRGAPHRALPAVAADQASRPPMKKPGLGRVFRD